MKRPAGLIVTAVVLALVSLLQVALALLTVTAANFKPRPSHAAAHAVPPPPAWMPIFMYGVGGLFFVLAVWGIWTAIDLHRLRNWARYSVLIIGGGMAMIGFFSALAMAALMFVPLPSSGVDPSHAETMRTVLKIGFAFFALVYAAMLAVGVWWLVYFNRRDVRALFVNAQGLIEENRRPFLISIIAVVLLIGAPSCVLMAYLPFPGLILGLTLRGWEKALFYLLYAALSAAVGIGLWRLKEWGRRLALALMALGAVNCCCVFVFFPSIMMRNSVEAEKALGLPEPQLTGHFQSAMSWTAMSWIWIVPSILMFIAAAAVLHHYRGKFTERAEPPGIEPRTAV